MKKFILILMMFFTASVVYGHGVGPGLVNMKETDGSPDVWVPTVIVTNGSLTDNGDGTVSLSSGGTGQAVTLDLGDDESNESSDLGEIATSGDTNSIFTEPSADKLLIDLSNNWPTADTANAGDSATAFFSAGTIEHEYGGLEADVSAYSGFVKIDAGSTSAVAVTANGESLITAADYAAMRTLLSVTATASDVIQTTDFTGGDIASGVYNNLQISEAGVDHDLLLNFAANEHFTQASITTVGTISSGVWNGTALVDAYVADTISIDHSSSGTMVLDQTTDCSAVTSEGQICWDTDGDALYIGDGAAASQIGGGGSGDVTGVGDCASGACLDGSSDGGSYIRVYDGDSHYGEFQVPDVSGNVTYTFPDATGTLVDSGDVLIRTNTDVFTPSADYHPATKKYVDDEVSAAGGGDVTAVGDCATGQCFDGTSDGGTSLDFYDAQGAVTFQVGDVSGAITLTLPAVATGTLYASGNTDVALADGGTGASLTDPNADRVYFWDDSDGATEWMSLKTNVFSLNASTNELTLADHATARSDLGLTIGTDVQAYDAFLQNIADMTDPGADRLIGWDDSAGAVALFTADTDDFEWSTTTFRLVAEIPHLDAAETIAGNWVNTANPWAVNEGGTGAATFTDGGILLGNADGAIQALGVATNGQIPIGDGTTDPVLATITGTAGEVVVTNGAGSITLTLADPITTGVTAGAGSTWDVADSVTRESVYSGTTSLEETNSPTDSGAYIIGVYDEFTNSASENVQDVLDDLDAAIAAANTAYNQILDPTGNGSIAFAGYTGTYTSATDGWGGLIIESTVDDNASVTTLLTLNMDDDWDGTNQKYIRAYNDDDTGADLIFELNADALQIGDGSASLATLDGSNGVDALFSDDVEVLGTLYVGGGIVTAGSSDPSAYVNDSDAEGTAIADELAGGFKANMPTGATTEDAEVSDFQLFNMDAGAERPFMVWLGETWTMYLGVLPTGDPSAWTADDVANYEQLTIDFDTGTNGVIEISSLSSSNLIVDMNRLDLEGPAAGAPLLALVDVDDAAGTASIRARSSGSQDMVLNLQVEETGSDVNYIQLDGVNDQVEVKELLVAESGIQFQSYIEGVANDTYTDCSAFGATNGGLFYDDSEGKWKKCEDNVLSDLDTTGSGSLGSNLTSTTNDITSDTTAISLASSSNSEDILLTFGADVLNITSTSNVTLVDFNTVNLATDSLDLSNGPITNVGNITTVSAAVINHGASTSLEIPNATGGTVNAAGEITLDTTDEQIVYYGTAERVLHYTSTECVVVENLAAADDNYEIWMANDAVTITGIGVHCRGTCTTGADISLEDRSGNAMTHTTPTHSTGTGNTTFQSVTAANGLVAGEGLAFDVDNAVSPETDEYTICFTYTYDRQ